MMHKKFKLQRVSHFARTFVCSSFFPLHTLVDWATLAGQWCQQSTALGLVYDAPMVNWDAFSLLSELLGVEPHVKGLALRVCCWGWPGRGGGSWARAESQKHRRLFFALSNPLWAITAPLEVFSKQPDA